MKEEKQDIRERYKMGYQGWQYAVQRLDLLTIAISGSGIYVVLSALQLSLTKHIVHLYLVKYAGIFFVLSIVINFVSQITGKESNHYDMLWSYEKLCCDDPATEQQENDINNYNKKANDFEVATDLLNYCSIISMSVGLFVLSYYFWITF